MAASTGLTARQGRKFAFTLGFALLVLGGISLWRGHDIVPYVLATPGALLVLAGVIAPTRLGPIERRWMAFGERLSRITSPIILGVIYFGVFTPAGLIRKALGKNSLTAHHKPETAWVRREAKQRSDLKRQY